MGLIDTVTLRVERFNDDMNKKEMLIDEAIEYLTDFSVYSPYQEAINKVSAYIEQMQADYNTRLKADMVAMLTELQLEIEDKAIRKQGIDSGFEYNYEFISSEEVIEIIQEKINAL